MPVFEPCNNESMAKVVWSERLHALLIESCQFARLVQGDVQRGAGQSIATETQKEGCGFWLRKYSVPKTTVTAQRGQRSGVNRDKTVFAELGFPHMKNAFLQIDVRPVE